MYVCVEGLYCRGMVGAETAEHAVPIAVVLCRLQQEDMNTFSQLAGSPEASSLSSSHNLMGSDIASMRPMSLSAAPPQIIPNMFAYQHETPQPPAYDPRYQPVNIRNGMYNANTGKTQSESLIYWQNFKWSSKQGTTFP